MRAAAEIPSPQRPTMSRDAQAPLPNLQPSAPAPSPVPAPAAASTPTLCPKCSGNLVNISGKFVCEKCFHSVDTPDAAQNPGVQGAQPLAAPLASAPGPGPGSAPAPGPALIPAQAQAQAPTPALATTTVCPKCSGNLVNISGKLVCDVCYHVVDTPSAAPAAKSALPFSKPAAPAFTPPTVCPKCSGTLMDVGGKYVCDACYHVVDTPNSSLSASKSSFTPRPTEQTEEDAMSPAIMGGGALIILLILMIVVLAIRH